MWAWLRQLRALVGPPPEVPAVAPEQASGGAPDWRRELLAESSWTWEAARVEQADLAAATRLGQAPPEEAAHPAAGPLPWVAPGLALPRAVFTRHGYEPGARPPSLGALRALLEAAYGPSLAPLASRVLHDLALFGALDAWQPSDRGNLARTHVVFRELSGLLGEALAFKPAPLGLIGDLGPHLGLYRDAERVVCLSSRLLAGSAAGLVNTVVHEQAHHLQHLLVQRLMYAPRKLAPIERSLALYWYDQGTVAPEANFLAYRLSGREIHADDTAKRVVRDLMPLFGWGPEALMA